jgi:shikimate kinase
MDDCIVKKAGKPITEIFAQDGEPHFRQLETQVLEELLQLKEPHIISAGGGVPMKTSNRTLLAQGGQVVYLQADVEVLVRRLAGDTTRPLLSGGDLREKIVSLKTKREGVYIKISDLQVETCGKTPEEIAAFIISGQE